MQHDKILLRDGLQPNRTIGIVLASMLGSMRAACVLWKLEEATHQNGHTRWRRVGKRVESC
jgi:hypothetical protein